MTPRHPLAPTPKVAGGVVGGAATTIVLWLLETYAHLQVPVPVAAAIGVLVTAGTAYLIPGARPPADPGGQPVVLQLDQAAANDSELARHILTMLHRDTPGRPDTT